MNTNNRANYLDMAKGIGILLVVMVHLFGTVQIIDPAPYKDLIAHFGNSCALTIFFLVSGILIYLKQDATKGIACDTPRRLCATLATSSFAKANASPGENFYLIGKFEELSYQAKKGCIPLKDFLQRKCNTLLYPYLTFSILYLIHEYIRHGFDAALVTKNDLKNILLDTLTLKGASVLWFFSALFFGEVIFYLMKKYLHPYIMTILLLISAILIFIYAPYLYKPFFAKNVATNILRNLILVLTRGLLTCAYLMLGYWIGALFAKLCVSKKTSFLLFLTGTLFLATDLLLCLSFEGVDYNRMIFGVWYIYAICSILGCIGTIFICKSIPSNRILTCLGRNSLLIMVTHLDFGILRNALSFAYAMNTKITHFKVLFLYMNIFLFVILFEVIVICLIKRFLPFLYQRK